MFDTIGGAFITFYALVIEGWWCGDVGGLVCRFLSFKFQIFLIFNISVVITRPASTFFIVSGDMVVFDRTGEDYPFSVLYPFVVSCLEFTSTERHWGWEEGGSFGIFSILMEQKKLLSTDPHLLRSFAFRTCCGADVDAFVDVCCSCIIDFDHFLRRIRRLFSMM